MFYSQTKQQDVQSIHTQTDPDTEAITNLALVVSLQQENADLTYQVGDLQDKLNDATYLAEDAQEQLDALQVLHQVKSAPSSTAVLLMSSCISILQFFFCF